MSRNGDNSNGATSAPSGAGRSARAIAIIGPYLSGKTTLLEAILERCGAITRAGTVTDGNTVGDSSAEARAHGMSVSLNMADAEFLGDRFTFIDCPGSIEFQHESALALTACDAAIVVCEPDPKRVPSLQLILKQLEDRGIPHFLFLNKIDISSTPVREIIPMLQPASTKPLVLRQIPIWENGVATGFIDLASERAYVYREHAVSEIVSIPEKDGDREHEARFHMLEQLADYDDALMEELLSDIEPPKDRIFDDLARELSEGLICPVMLGSASHGHGISRLLKALRHEVPFVDATARRLKLETTSQSAFIFKTLHTTHGGKLSFARVLTGEIPDGATLTGADGREERASGIFTMVGEEPKKRGTAAAGDTVALGRLEHMRSGETITTGKNSIVQVPSPVPPYAVFGVGLGLKDRKDEVKLTGAVHKLVEEDPSLSVEQSQDTHQLLLLGQGEMHMRVSLERLERKFAVPVVREKRHIPYKETIRKNVEIRGRHKKQSGGHGQFGDVLVDIAPLPRGDGFQFDEKITGGAIPKQFIPSVEIGVKDFMQQGPLGFPVVDIAVTLKDGSFHTVDSSDMAFRQAARIAMSDGMPKCSPVLLEPVMAVEIQIPTEATARINGIIPQRRGQILGFDAREGWPGWDVVQAHIPQAEMEDLIVELRSLTAGVGTFTASFDHLAELTGKLADHVLAQHKPAAA
ncbi:MAG: elongation factor G [Hyphomicrobiaceae bacterium]|nr:elongation factor G [Hyphomicrobiaceae bacterium]